MDLLVERMSWTVPTFPKQTNSFPPQRERSRVVLIIRETLKSVELFFSRESEDEDEDVETKLMLEYQKGSEEAFIQLYHRIKAPLYNWIYRMVVNESIAEEMVHETLLRVYRSKYAYRPKAKFKTWCFTIAKNLFLTYISKNSIAFEELENFSIESKEQSLDENVARKQRESIILRGLSNIPHRQKIAITLRYFQDFSHEEIATTMHISQKAVKSLLNRGLDSLEKVLAKEEKK